MLELSKLIIDKKYLWHKNDLITKLSIGLKVINTIAKQELEIFSIFNTVLHLKCKNIVLDRNKVSKCMKTGKEYKGYLFYPLSMKK